MLLCFRSAEPVVFLLGCLLEGSGIGMGLGVDGALGVVFLFCLLLLFFFEVVAAGVGVLGGGSVSPF